MSRYGPQELYNLVPAVYRQRDAGQGYPLRDLVTALAEQAMVLEGDIERLYDSWFIETCDDWVVPYLGDLVGVQGVPPRGEQRAEVANTIAYRRRKGTAGVIASLARDATGWPARVVETFERLAANQSLHHLRPHARRTLEVRRADALELLGGPFETAAHRTDVRRIASRRTRGRYGIGNVAIFLWRLAAYRLDAVQPAVVGDGSGRRFTCNVLGLDEPLFTPPIAGDGREPDNAEAGVPAPVRRRALHAERRRQEEAAAGAIVPPPAYFGPGLAIELFGRAADGNRIPLDGRVVAADLADWVHEPPAGAVAIDPRLGRIAFGTGVPIPPDLRATYYYGCADDFGGGAYEREASFTRIAGEARIRVGLDDALTARPGEPPAPPWPTIQQALAEGWAGTGSAVIEIVDSRTYAEALLMPPIPSGARLELRASNGQRPCLLLGGELVVEGGENSAFELNGLLVAGGGLRTKGELDLLAIRHSTLAPLADLAAGADAPVLPSLVVESRDTEVRIERSILGPVAAADDSEMALSDSILDAGDEGAGACVGTGAVGLPAASGLAGALSLVRCTLIGRVAARELTLAENSILLGRVETGRVQAGCVRFCWLPASSRTPRRYQCRTDADGPPPRLTSRRYGHPAYCRLADPLEAVRRGADDESEMGVFCGLREAHREDYLRLRLDEYLRVGLEAGIFFVT